MRTCGSPGDGPEFILLYSVANGTERLLESTLLLEGLLLDGGLLKSDLLECSLLLLHVDLRSGMLGMSLGLLLEGSLLLLLLDGLGVCVGLLLEGLLLRGML